MITCLFAYVTRTGTTHKYTAFELKGDTWQEVTELAEELGAVTSLMLAVEQLGTCFEPSSFGLDGVEALFDSVEVLPDL